MPKAVARDPCLVQLTKICLALPQAVCEYMGDHAKYAVKKKVFAYFLNNHHGDGIVAISTKVGPGDNTSLVAAMPDRFYLPAYIGSRGWVAMRLDREPVDWDEVTELIKDSYRRTAPKRLAAEVHLEEYPSGS